MRMRVEGLGSHGSGPLLRFYGDGLCAPSPFLPPPRPQLTFLTPWSLVATDGGGGGGGVRSPAVDCRVFLNFFQILLGIVLPTLALARMNSPLASTADARPRAPAAAQPAATGRLPGQRLARLRAVAARAAACGARAAAAAEGALQHLCSMLAGRAGSLLLTAASWWALLSWCWVLATALEHPSVSAWLGVPLSSSHAA